MRLYLLPISTRRTLIYCQRLNEASHLQPGIAGWPDKLTQKAATKWAEWEKKEKGWQRKLTDYGNKALQNIPYEEWGLKSIPPLSAKRKQDALEGKGTVDVVFPDIVIRRSEVLSTLQTLATERMAFHRSRLIYSIIGMPITIPVMIIPVIPNIPFFYLLFRAWSHWRALSGSRHIQFLLKKNLINPIDSKILNEIYAEPVRRNDAWIKTSKETDDMMLLTKTTSREIANQLAVPELAVELERAVWQVWTALEKKRETDARENSSGDEAGEKIDPGEKNTKR